MSRTEIISLSSPIDHQLIIVQPLNIIHQEQPERSTHNVFVNELFLGAKTLRLASAPSHTHVCGDVIFPSLPALQYGHSDVSLRNGIMRASRAAQAGEPDAEKAFFVADLSVVLRQHKRWKQCLPDIQPFYAVKCNPDPYVIRLLAALGTGFDCASKAEINQVLDLGGVSPSRIIYANPCKATSFIRSAAQAGVDMMTFDNEDELHKIARTHPDAKLVLRIATDDTKSLCRLSVKFGALIMAVPALLAKAKDLHLNVIGVSFHVGSGCFDPSIYNDAVMRARTAFDLGRQAGYHFTLLDVGGGFEDALFEKAAAILTDAIDRYFPDRHELTVIAEPGRFYVSTAFRLAANVIARRAPEAPDPAHATNEASEEPRAMYYISEGLYGAFNCILFDHQTVHPYVLSMNGSFHVPASEPVSSAAVWGPTCDSIDLVCPKAELPVGIQVGDWLGFDNMGAYTVCAASQFNGFEFSKVNYTAGGHLWKEVREALVTFASEGYGA